MNDKILAPNFSNDEPNLISTRKKNNDGLCCFHNCKNKLPKEKYEYMGFLACEECGLKLRSEWKRWSDELYIEKMQEAIRRLKASENK